MIQNELSLPRPALKRGHDKEGEHRLCHVVVVEGVPLPRAVLHDRIVQVAVLVNHELAWKKVHVKY